MTEIQKQAIWDRLAVGTWLGDPNRKCPCGFGRLFDGHQCAP